MPNKFNTKTPIIEKILFALICAILILFVCSLLLPFLWMIWTSFKDQYYYITNPFGLPDKWFFTNYKDIISILTATGVNRYGESITYGIPSMLFYSFIISAGISFMGVLLPGVTAYIVSRYKFVGKNFLYNLAIITMIIPIVGSLPSSLRIMTALGLRNNLIPFILTYGSPFGFSFLFFYGAFKGISWNYAEAAFIDGGSHTTVMWRIMFPMMLPTLATMFILGFIGNWNDYTVVYTWLPGYPNLAYGVYSFQAEASRLGYGMPHQLAGFVIVAIPTAILWAISQKLITSKFTVGGLKG